MKLLIAYDGSKDAEAAIDDLRFCGLPSSGTAEVMSVAEVWLPPPDSLDETDEPPERIEEILRDRRQKAEKAVSEAEMLARFAAGRVRSALPDWVVTPSASYGSPGWEIVTESDEFDADLILVGAQGHSFLSRLVLGSISQRVLTEATCSVRIGRGSIDVELGPERIVVGFDGSRGANVAVKAVADRHWPDGTEVKLVTASDPVVPPSIARFLPPVAQSIEGLVSSETLEVDSAAKSAIELLQSRGLEASYKSVAGNPRHVLPFEAEAWGADCIFVGANAWGSRLERFLIGSTSAAVAARSHCSVEAVRATLSANSISDKDSEPGERSNKNNLTRGERA